MTFTNTFARRALLVAVALLGTQHGRTLAQKDGEPVVQHLNDGEAPPLSTAMRAVFLLMGTFFFIEIFPFLLSIQGEMEKVKSAFSSDTKKDDGKNEEEGASLTNPDVDSPSMKKLQEQLQRIQSMVLATSNVTKQIPMLAILIVFTRLRAKLDLEGTEPRASTKGAFTAISVFVLLQAISLALNSCMAEQATVGKYVRIGNVLIQSISKFGIYICILIIFFSVPALVKKAVVPV